MVEYSLDYAHTVQIGITAGSAGEAVRIAETAFSEGWIWDDTDETPLLYDEYDEKDGNTLVFEVVSGPDQE